MNQLFSLRAVESTGAVGSRAYVRTDATTHWAMVHTDDFEMAATWMKANNNYSAQIRKKKSKGRWTKGELKYLQQRGYTIEWNYADKEM